VEIREAVAADAGAMSVVLQELVAAGKRTENADADFALSHCIEHPHRLHCFVAVDDERKIVGLQSLKRAHEGNPYGTPVGLGIIGTHVTPSVTPTVVGSRLFAATLAGARTTNLPATETYIGEQNSSALVYHGSLGFRAYRRKSLHL
jgi:hypothetical protein